MAKLNINHLSISWSTSRGRDTYGYNICRLDDRNNGKRYRTCGGGYDMIGTVFGEWLADVYQDRLQAFFVANQDKLERYASTQRLIHPDYYGAFVRPDGSISLDGACGIESMRRIAEALALEVQWEGNKKGHTIGYFVSEEVSA